MGPLKIPIKNLLPFSLLWRTFYGDCGTALISKEKKERIICHSLDR